MSSLRCWQITNRWRRRSGSRSRRDSIWCADLFVGLVRRPTEPTRNGVPREESGVLMSGPPCGVESEGPPGEPGVAVAVGLLLSVVPLGTRLPN